MIMTNNLSLLEYFNKLQLEYLLYEFRLKIYVSRVDKDKFSKILQYKKQKISDISLSNGLFNMFNNEDIRNEIKKEFYNDFGVPKILNNKDKYFYYYLGGDFSYNGFPTKLISYDFKNQTCIVYHKQKEMEIDLNLIKRIL